MNRDYIWVIPSFNKTYELDIIFYNKKYILKFNDSVNYQNAIEQIIESINGFSK